VARQKLAAAVDAFCETIGFTPEQTERIFMAARKHSLPVKLHAEQLSDQGGTARRPFQGPFGRSSRICNEFRAKEASVSVEDDPDFNNDFDLDKGCKTNAAINVSIIRKTQNLFPQRFSLDSLKFSCPNIQIIPVVIRLFRNKFIETLFRQTV